MHKFKLYSSHFFCVPYFLLYDEKSGTFEILVVCCNRNEKNLISSLSHEFSKLKEMRSVC